MKTEKGFVPFKINFSAWNDLWEVTELAKGGRKK